MTTATPLVCFYDFFDNIRGVDGSPRGDNARYTVRTL